MSDNRVLRAAASNSQGSRAPYDEPTALSGPHQRVHAFLDDVLEDADASEIARRIAARQISALEAVEASIARIEAVEPYLHAVVVRDYDRARQRAANPGLGAFAGVPTATKDNITVAGVPITQGSDAPPATPAKVSGGFAKQLLATSAIPLATTTMPSFGWTATTERSGARVTRNPWDTAYSAGGSSGGSAALVASGALPFAHGNDGGGSIRIPAAACGLVGLKVTRGRVLGDPTTDALPVQLITNGVLTRTVRDTANFFAAAESSYCQAKLPPIGRVTGPSSERRRIGLWLDSPFGVPTDGPTRMAVLDLAGRLENLGHQVEPLEPHLPASFTSDFENYWSLLAAAVAKAGKLAMGRSFDADKLDGVTLGLAGLLHLPGLPVAIARLAASGRVYDKTLRGWDAVLSPVVAHTTPVVGYLGADIEFKEHYARLLDYVSFTPLHNAAGAPAISLPTGMTADGRPIGTMLQAARGADALLLELAFEIEQDCAFCTPTP